MKNGNYSLLDPSLVPIGAKSCFGELNQIDDSVIKNALFHSRDKNLESALKLKHLLHIIVKNEV